MSNSVDYRYPLALIGAGPGDPELITVKGQRLLRQADIVIYDYLANKDLLALVRDDAKFIAVGKKGFTNHITQDEINEILVAQAKENPQARIVRLKGGDPFVFGRGGEEALALMDEGIPFEVVPGVTSGIAAPAYAGIPVTQRKVASSVAFITGHEAADKMESSIDWEHLAKGCDTLCFYMGVKSLPLICGKLIDAGRPPQTPIALVRWGSMPFQETLVSTLENAAEDACKANFAAPAMIVVGDVVSLRQQLSWFESRPLFGKTVVVTRARAQASDLSERLRLQGAQVVEAPAIRIDPIPEDDAMIRAMKSLADYSWVVFTSVNGVDTFFDALGRNGLDARAFGGCKVAAIGVATAQACRDRGIVADLVPKRYVAEEMAAALLDAGAAGQPVLIPRAQEARETLPVILRDAGCTVDVLPMYRTLPERDSQGFDQALELLGQGKVDAITFTSSSTVRYFIGMLEDALGADAAKAAMRNVGLFSIGPVTSSALEEYGLSPAAEAQVYTIDGLVECLHSALAGK